MIIYRHTNLVNGNVYIGQSIRNAAVRWEECVSDAKNGCVTRIASAIRKYGEIAFKTDILYAAKTQRELDMMEIFFIILHQSHIYGYNVTLGQGHAGPHTQETKDLIREKVLANYASTDLRERIRVAAKNRKAASYRRIACTQEKAEKIRQTLLIRYANGELEKQRELNRQKHTGNGAKRKRTRIRLCYVCFHPFEAKDHLERVCCSVRCDAKRKKVVKF